jgi:hypothetical protein
MGVICDIVSCVVVAMCQLVEAIRRAADLCSGWVRAKLLSNAVTETNVV